MADLGYPNEPGWRRGPNSATSKEGADAAKEMAGSLKSLVLDRLRNGPASPEEMVIHFRERGKVALLNTVRARCTDLNRLGLVCPSGTFGIGESQKVRVIRWRLTTDLERALFAARKAAEAEKGEAQ